MAGYSGTPLPKKLGIGPGHRVVAVSAPPGFVEGLELPEGARFVAVEGEEALDVAMVFASREADLVAGVAPLRARLTPAGSLWMAWPKKASKLPTDLTEDRLRALYLPTGLVDNKVCAIDDTWSGLRFVLRKELRR